MAQDANQITYGRSELRRQYNTYLTAALGISLAIHVIVILLYSNGGGPSARLVLAELPPPRTDTVWTQIRMDDPQSSPAKAGGGDPLVKAPEAPSSKGHQDARADRSHNRPDPKHTVLVDVPNKPHVVRDQPKQPDIAGDTKDTSKRTGVRGTQGQDVNGTGDRPASGSGGHGVGVGSASGLGSRGWLVRPGARYPAGTNATGTVVLRFTVLPNGDVVNISPVKRADQSLVDAAISNLRRAKARPLPESSDQVAQVATIPFIFKLQ